MANRTVKESDLTSELILDEGQLATLTILKHPALTDGPAVIEAAVGELKTVERHALDVVIFDLQLPDQEPRRIVMETKNFDALAKDRDMTGVLQAAQSVKAPRATAASNSERVDYSDPQNAGIIHRGKITEEEARLVRENLEQANANRARVGQAPVNVNDPKEQQRYGLPDQRRFTAA